MKIISKKNSNITLIEEMYHTDFRFFAAYEFLICIINNSRYLYYINDNYFNEIIYKNLGFCTNYGKKKLFLSYCFIFNLFNREKYDTYKILTNEDLQHSYKTECQNLHTKCEIKEEYRLIEIDNRKNNIKSASPSTPSEQEVEENIKKIEFENLKTKK